MHGGKREGEEGKNPCQNQPETILLLLLPQKFPNQISTETTNTCFLRQERRRTSYACQGREAEEGVGVLGGRPVINHARQAFQQGFRIKQLVVAGPRQGMEARARHREGRSPLTPSTAKVSHKEACPSLNREGRSRVHAVCKNLPVLSHPCLAVCFHVMHTCNVSNLSPVTACMESRRRMEVGREREGREGQEERRLRDGSGRKVKRQW